MTKKTDTKAEATTSVVVAEKRLIGQPGVIAVGGVILEPIAQYPKVNGQLVHNGVLLVDYHFGRIGDKKAPLNVYTYTAKSSDNTKAIDMFIVADETSSLDIEIPRYLDFQDESFTTITLINSIVKNDYLAGNVLLANVDTSNSAFVDSIIELAPHHYLPPVAGSQLKPEDSRIKIGEVDAHKLLFRGRSLPSGTYHNSDLFENNFVRGEMEDDQKPIRIYDSALRWNSFREGRVEINASTITHCGFHFTGDVFIDKVDVADEYFGHLPSIYLSSKFDLTSIDVAGKVPAEMIRVDMDNVIVTLPTDREIYVKGEAKKTFLKMSFRNPNSRRAIRHKAMDMLFGENMPSEMEESVLDYLVDTMLSRCGMMNLVDSAKRLLNNTLLGAKPLKRSALSIPGLPAFLDDRVGDVYGTSTSLANEYDKTIYIDGKNFKS